MKTYTIEFEFGHTGRMKALASGAYIVELPEAYIHFGHHDFDIVWSEETNRQESVPAQKFFGGMGEGSSFDTWQDALHVSLYDLYQVCDDLHKGDQFVAIYNGETQWYACDGVHVVQVTK